MTNSRLNALLIGPRHLTGRLILSLRPRLARPIIQVFSHIPMMLPQADQVGTVILEDVDCLDNAAQMYVLEWLQRAVSPTRVIGTSTIRLLPMVAAGTFERTLYYRLNLVYVNC